MISKAEILAKLSELKPALKKEYAVKEIGLFGSYSDNTFSDDSDIDILVVWNNLSDGNFFHLSFFLNRFFIKKLI